MSGKVWAALACALASVSTAAAAETTADITHVYTRIDDVRGGKGGLCRTVKTSGERENPIVEERCPPGPSGWSVTMVSMDARTEVTFGKQADQSFGVFQALKGAFADPYHTVEWRLRNGRPFAAIHRYFYDDKQALTVHKLAQDKTSCVAAVVTVERGRDANAEAERVADTIVPTFRCGTDKLLVIGHTADSID